MSIRVDADNTHFLGEPAERDLAQRLDECFTITFGRHHGDLSKWLAEPKAHIAERFGFAKELLVIYSKHPRTDARVLTAIEHISRDPEFKHRIDRAVVLLIHNGNPADTESLLRERLDWIVVPISSTEISEPTRGPLFLRSRIANAIGDVDLFAMSSPITDDKYFFGRDSTVQELVTRAVDRGENSGLFGLRKTGKTSVLFAVQRRLGGSEVLVEYADCQNPGVHAARWWSVLEGLAKRCASTLLNSRMRTVQLSGGYTEATAGNQFLSDMRAVLADGAVPRVVFLLDEIEYITPLISGALGRHWDNDFLPFWQTIRSVHHEVLGKITFVVAGVNPLAVTTSHFGTTPNPIFQLAQPMFLEPMDISRVREMVRTIGRYSGLNISEDVYAYLAQLYGGHPFLIRLACSEVWRATDVRDPERRASITVDSFEQHARQVASRLDQPVRDILLSLVWWYPEEYDLLRILADGDGEFAAQYLEGNPATVLHFAHYGLLTPDRTAFAIGVLKEFLKQHGDEYRSQLSPFTRGDIPPELLPQVPDLDALGRLFEQRTEVELLLRKAILLYLGIKTNWDPAKIAKAMAKGISQRAERRDTPENLFVGRTPQVVINDLYTTDLKSIILVNWDVFGPLFGDNKGRFEMNMDSLNKARRIDAHAKPIPPHEVDEIHNSRAWLKARLGAIPKLD